jgi:hypothetical protein
MNWGSSVSTMPDYRLEDQDSIPIKHMGFFFYRLAEAHKVSHLMGGRGGVDADDSPST